MWPSAPKPLSRQNNPFSRGSREPDNLCTFVSPAQKVTNLELTSASIGLSATMRRAHSQGMTSRPAPLSGCRIAAARWSSGQPETTVLARQDLFAREFPVLHGRVGTTRSGCGMWRPGPRSPEVRHVVSERCDGPHGEGVVVEEAGDTCFSHAPRSRIGPCIRLRSSAFTSLSFAHTRSRRLFLFTWNLPARDSPQMWVMDPCTSRILGCLCVRGAH